MTALFALYVLLALLDGWTTWKILGAGGRELNPLLRYLIERTNLMTALVISRIFLIACGAAVLPLSWWWLGACAAILGAVQVNNLLVMRRLKLL